MKFYKNTLDSLIKVTSVFFTYTKSVVYDLSN
jgi:hypothetical protein